MCGRERERLVNLSWENTKIHMKCMDGCVYVDFGINNNFYNPLHLESIGILNTSKSK
jgi:hypothetical protein